MYQPTVVYPHSRISTKTRCLRLTVLALILTGAAFTLSAQSNSNELSFADSLQRLERQPEHPQFFERLTETALLADSPRLATEIILKHRHRIRRPSELAELNLVLGRFAQIQSNLSGAGEYFAAAAEADTPLRARALTALAALQLEFGELEEALATSRQASVLIGRPSAPVAERGVSNGTSSEFRSWERSLLTQSSALAALDRADEAIELLKSVVAETTPKATPALLLRLIELAAEQDESELLEATYTTLVAEYPDSPERRLAARYREGGTAGVVGAALVEYFPSPSRLLSGASPEIATRREPGPEASRETPADDAQRGDPSSPETPASPGAPTSPETPAGDAPARGVTSARTVYAVQTGSFRDPENAQYMVRDLQGQSFQARQRSRTVGDNEFYQVYVPLDGGDPQELLVRLKEGGFEGFLLFE